MKLTCFSLMTHPLVRVFGPESGCGLFEGMRSLRAQRNNTRTAMFGEGQRRPATSELAVGTESVACWVERSANSQRRLVFSS